MSRSRVFFAALLTLATLTAEARTRSARPTLPALDPATLYSLQLQFGSVDVNPGDERTLQLWHWQCCVYPVVVKADVRFYMDPTDLATLDAESGILHIAADARGGSSFRVYADVEHGRRLLSADVYIDTPASNPFRGYWTETLEIPCDGTPPRVPLQPITELVFNGDGTFSATWMPFEVYKDYWGVYSFDHPKGHVNFAIRGGNYVPPTFRGDGSWNIVTENGKQVLTFRGMSFGRPRNETLGSDCGAFFSAR